MSVTSEVLYLSLSLSLSLSLLSLSVSLSLSLFLSLSLSLQDEVKAELEQYCSDLSFLQSECKTMIDDYFDEIWDLLLTYTVGLPVCFIDLM